ncbi:hypothetical protein GCM10025868_21550 [Angustibacter aerolatus]|uniref:HTH luxR-type domain-containing protein n=1 Tax=Angustibacter aerolatus TaxID=1162965 RepID=A0ABQ6JJA6_9ACTN|nr:hypothetical protein GCM10025868_21550 [Angustibacter aerolatus]
MLARLVALAATSSGADPAQDGPAATGSRAVGPPLGTTPREWQVGRCVAQGLSNAEIAGVLFLSTTTVKTHVTHLFEKRTSATGCRLAVRVLELDGPG